MLNYYDARVGASPYGGMFDPSKFKPFCLYYAFKAFGELYCLGDQAECTVEGEGLYAVAATNGRKNALMISNQTGEAQPLQIEGVDLSDAHIYQIDQRHLLSMAFDANEIKNDTVLLIEW